MGAARLLSAALIDTSVLLASDLELAVEEVAISAASLAELHYGIYAAPTNDARVARLQRLAEIESRLDPLPIDARVARSFGALAHSAVAKGRNPRRMTIDLLIAATAHAHRLPLYTRDSRDFSPFADVIDVHVV